MKTLLLLLSLFTAPLAHAGDKTGNGGDHIRAEFLKKGEEVIHFLKSDPAGQRLAREHQLNLAALNNALLAEKIQVVSAGLTDNSGSLADATGEPGKIQLDQLAWKEHLDQNRDVHYLVFHEMLRESRKNDDDYRISKRINPFRGKQGCSRCDELHEYPRALREEFRMAKRPSLADLRLGQNWYCMHYITNSTGFHFGSAPRPEYRFTQSTNSPMYFSSPSFQGGQKMDFTRAYDPIRNEYSEFSGWSGRGETQQAAHVRVRPNGDLVVERTSPPSAGGNYPLPSLAKCDHGVIAYMLCKPQAF